MLYGSVDAAGIFSVTIWCRYESFFKQKKKNNKEKNRKEKTNDKLKNKNQKS